jgi:hypothetical protein
MITGWLILVSALSTGLGVTLEHILQDQGWSLPWAISAATVIAVIFQWLFGYAIMVWSFVRRFLEPRWFLEGAWVESFKDGEKIRHAFIEIYFFPWSKDHYVISGITYPEDDGIFYCWDADHIEYDPKKHSLRAYYSSRQWGTNPPKGTPTDGWTIMKFYPEMGKFHNGRGFFVETGESSKVIDTRWNHLTSKQICNTIGKKHCETDEDKIKLIHEFAPQSGDSTKIVV